MNSYSGRVIPSRRGRRGTFSFLYFELIQHVFTRLRWALVSLVCAFIAYAVFGAVLAQSKNTSLAANTWDVLWVVLTNQRLVLFSLTPLFCYLASDLLPEPAFGQEMLFRLGSRRMWWLGKTITLALTVIFYSGLSALVLIAIASIVLPWERGWSPLSFQKFLEWGAPPAIVALSPSAIIGLQLTLLGLWWFFLGLLVMIVAQQFQRSAAGFVAGIIINFVTQAIDWYGVFPSSIANFLSREQIFVFTRAVQDSGWEIVTVVYMIAHWVVWITVIYFWGLKMSLRQDFIQARETV